MSELLISGGTLVNEGRRFRGHLLVRDGVITAVGEGHYPHDETFSGTRIDASGRIVMPGVIDPHVHFREPGLTYKGDMASESAAAVAGGVTSVLEMPNTVPQTVDCDALARKFDLAEGRMHTNYSFFLGATTDNLHEIRQFWNNGGRIVKLFMGSSTGGMLVTESRALTALFAEFDGVIAAHCEDESIIRSATEIYRKRLGDSATAVIHPSVRSAEACYVATARAIELADRYDTRLHVCHVSTARELALFSVGPMAPKRITAEVCVPHLWFSEEDYARLGNRIKCNPSIKSAADRQALRVALAGVGESSGAFGSAGISGPSGGFGPVGNCGRMGDYRGRADVVATDHAPHTADEKSLGYWEAPSGIPSVQHALSAMLTLAADGAIELETVIERMCHAPAVRFGIARRGFLRQGYAADIVIVDPSEGSACSQDSGEPNGVVSPENIISKCGWSPWEGARFGSKIICTIVGGRIAWDGARVSETAAGQRLEFV